MLQEDCPQVHVVATCSNGEQGLTAIQKYSAELVFLDVEMPKMNGFEMLEQLSTVNFHLIFTTSYDQYALRAIRFSAIDYLLKPIDRVELKKAVQKAEQRVQVPIPQQLEILLQKLRQPSESINKIALPTVDGLQMIAINTIITCEFDDNYSTLYFKNGKKLLVTRSLKDIEEALEQYSFLRVHRSYLVNLNEIEKYIRGEGGYLIMSDGSTVDVSRSRKELLMQKLQPSKFYLVIAALLTFPFLIRTCSMDYISHLSTDKKLKKIIDGQQPAELKFRKNICLRLCASIMSQQLSTKVAAVIYKRFLEIYGGEEPSPQQIIVTPFDRLRAIGLSNAKAQYVLNVAQFAIDHSLTDTKLKKMSNEEIIDLLTQIKGVGKWTVEMLLMFTLGREDVFAIDDFGIQSSMKKLYKLDDSSKKIFREKLLKISDKWSPFRTFACMHLWRWKDTPV